MGIDPSLRPGYHSGLPFKKSHFFALLSFYYYFSSSVSIYIYSTHAYRYIFSPCPPPITRLSRAYRVLWALCRPGLCPTAGLPCFFPDSNTVRARKRSFLVFLATSAPCLVMWAENYPWIRSDYVLSFFGRKYIIYCYRVRQ